MHRAFQTAVTYFEPELVVFLGDVFDEGKWAGDEEFRDYIFRFVQGCPSGHGTQFVDIEIKVPAEYSLRT